MISVAGGGIISFDREALQMGKLSTVDLLVLTSKDQVLFILQALFSFLTKQVVLMRRSTVLSPPLQLAFPGFGQKQV